MVAAKTGRLHTTKSKRIDWSTTAFEGRKRGRGEGYVGKQTDTDRRHGCLLVANTQLPT